MAGETDLEVLLRTMGPRLREEPYVFCSVDEATYARLPVAPLGMFREDEGVSLIVSQAQADAAGLPYDERWACISLSVHSALAAVGLTAAVSARLAAVGLSANVVAAYYHDHVFVPWERRAEALAALESAGRPR